MSLIEFIFLVFLYVMTNPIKAVMLVGLGAAVAVMGPFIVSLPLGQARREWIANTYYFPAMMRWLKRACLVVPEQGSPTIKRSHIDAKLGTEYVYMDDDEKHCKDPKDNMGYLHGYPFGMADLASGLIVTPQDCHLASIWRTRDRNGSLRHEDDAGQQWARGLINIEPGRHIVQLTGSRPAAAGSGSASVAARVKRFIEISQMEFNSRPNVDYIIWLTSLGVGVGLPWLASKLSDNPGGTVALPVGQIVGVMPW